MRERIGTFAVEPTPSIGIRIASGSILIEEGSAGSIHVSIGASNPDKLIVTQFQNHIQIGEEGRLRGSYRIRVEVPSRTQVEVAVASGTVDIRAPIGDLNTRSASGDVSARRVLGRAEIKVASGDVTIGEADGDVRVQAASGDIDINHVHKDCSAATGAGDIRLGIVGGDLTTKTAAGNLLVERFEGGTLVARTVSGKLDVRIPPGARVDLDLRTLSGRVDLPPPADGPAPTRDVRVTAKSVSGPISIGRAE